HVEELLLDRQVAFHLDDEGRAAEEVGQQQPEQPVPVAQRFPLGSHRAALLNPVQFYPAPARAEGAAKWCGHTSGSNQTEAARAAPCGAAVCGVGPVGGRSVGPDTGGSAPRTGPPDAPPVAGLPVAPPAAASATAPAASPAAAPATPPAAPAGSTGRSAP